jgi:hypothetical protein
VPEAFGDQQPRARPGARQGLPAGERGLAVGAVVDDQKRHAQVRPGPARIQLVPAHPDLALDAPPHPAARFGREPDQAGELAGISVEVDARRHADQPVRREPPRQSVCRRHRPGRVGHDPGERSVGVGEHPQRLGDHDEGGAAAR